MSLAYIRRVYHVPAFRGRRVRVCGRRGRITSARGPHVRILLTGEHRPRTYHPTDEAIDWI